MAKRSKVVVTLTAGKTSAGTLYAYAEPDPAVMYEGDTITWEVVAYNGVKNVRPAHVRLTGTVMDPGPFTGPLQRKVTKAGTVFTAKGKKSKITRIYKYDIMVGNTVVADPDVQIKER